MTTRLTFRDSLFGFVLTALVSLLGCGGRSAEDDSRPSTGGAGGGGPGAGGQSEGGAGGGPSPISTGGVSGSMAGGAGAAGGGGANGAAGGGSTGSTGGGANNGGGEPCSCPPRPCEPPFRITVYGTGDVALFGLEALGDGVEFRCSENECSRAGCYLEKFPEASGPVVVTLSAPGYQRTEVEVLLEPRGDCGCCACCAEKTEEVEVVLEVLEDPPSDLVCCADLNNDEQNCGACGHSCNESPEGPVCEGGRCTVGFN
jgi:hypothetical protein